jgi:IS5 family transposase
LTETPLVSGKLLQAQMFKSRSVPQLFSSHLSQICDTRHPIRILADRIDWETLISQVSKAFPAKTGRPPEDPRLVLGLLLLKETYGESDESSVARFVESIYWQYFCGMQEIQWTCPVDPTTLLRWRKRLADKGLSDLLASTIQAGLATKALRREDTKHLIVDTTVQEKAIAHPTDARLCHRMRQKLVALANRAGVPLRQSYERVGKKLLIRHNRQRHLKHHRLANKALKELRTRLGAVMRDLERKMDQAREDMRGKIREALDLAHRVHGQVKQKKAAGRVFSLHEPEVDCIGKGKAHKKWEFGCKIGLVSTSRSNFILASNAYPGNPHDGHVLSNLLLEAIQHVPSPIVPQVSVDQGFKGHGIPGMQIDIVGRYLPKDPTRRKWMKRRAAIEPLIGHLKNDNGYRRNHLRGTTGDKLAAVLSACGYNLRQCLRAIARRLASLFGLDDFDILDALEAICFDQGLLKTAA